MKYVQRLMSIGLPYSEAVSICHSMEKEGRLEEYVVQQEREYARTIIQDADAEGIFE